MNVARRKIHNPRLFVALQHDAKAHRAPLTLQPIAWGQPDLRLARNLGALLIAATPKFRFKGLRALLKPITD